ncbi:hypothetical protein SKAU_G00212860 [Synaphobranchus kaupii]|uniref:Uncharacterized protein n=1 Tax=Synaphobranchus kaupii TaxID=118154 RepID=A0A9Q1IUQ9_SYNKA|nr:hypothetical protein SKAU_G00212860 [Synaphobranchus kaupii]
MNEEFPVSAGHKLALIKSLPFVHTARRYYRLDGLVRSSDRPRRGRSRPWRSAEKTIKLDYLEELCLPAVSGGGPPGSFFFPSKLARPRRASGGEDRAPDPPLLSGTDSLHARAAVGDAALGRDTLIIDTSNAPCGPGFFPGLRLSEGRFAIDRELPFPPPGGLGGPRLGPSQGKKAAPETGPRPSSGLPRTLRPPKTRPLSLRRGKRVAQRRPPPPPSGGAVRYPLDERGCRWFRHPRCPRLGRASVSDRREGGSGPRRTPLLRPATRERTRGPRARAEKAARPPPPPRASTVFPTTTSDQTRRPAEFKHITKRRKRN